MAHRFRLVDVRHHPAGANILPVVVGSGLACSRSPLIRRCRAGPLLVGTFAIGASGFSLNVSAVLPGLKR